MKKGLILITFSIGTCVGIACKDLINKFLIKKNDNQVVRLDLDLINKKIKLYFGGDLIAEEQFGPNFDKNITKRIYEILDKNLTLEIGDNK